MEKPALSLADYSLILTSSLFTSLLTITLITRKIVRYPYPELIVPSLVIIGAVAWFSSSKLHRPKSLARKYCLLFGIYLLLIGIPKLLLLSKPAWKLLSIIAAIELTSYAPLILGMTLVLSTRFALMDWKKILVLLLILLGSMFFLFNMLIAKTAPPFQEVRNIFDVPSILLLHILLDILCLALSTIGSLTLPKGLLRSIMIVFQIVSFLTVFVDVSFWLKRMELPIFSGKFLISLIRLIYPSISAFLPFFYYSQARKIVSKVKLQND